MGPKKPTKKELAEQKAEEERLAALAEEERLERERLEREEELKRLAEEKQQWLQAETQRMTEEKEEVAQHVVRREQLLISEQAARKEKEDWDNFISCTHLPDFSEDSEISTYIGLWEEDPDKDLEQVLKETQQACDVIDGLEKMVAQAMGQKAFDQADKFRNYMKRLRQLVKFKLDHASAELLEHLGPYTDPKDHTCQHSLSTATQRYGIWVNTTRNVRIKAIEYASLGLKTDIPRTIILQTVAVRMMHFRKDLVSPFASGDFFTIGGVLWIECLSVPESPKPIKSHVPDVKDSGSWNYIQITDKKGEVERQPYPPIDPTTGQMQTVGVPPMKVDWQLPADVLIAEGTVPVVGWWDERIGDSGGWNTEGITDIAIEAAEGERTLSFSTVHLTALAILQCRWACFPFQSWMLQPMAPNKAMLSLEIKGNLTFRFEIGAGECRLLHPSDESLRPLREKPLAPMELLRRLLHYGINLIPSEPDAAEVSNKRWDCAALQKTKELEARVCSGLSMLAPAFTLCHSPLNPMIGPKDATVKLAPTTDYQSAALTADDESLRTLLFRQAPTDADLDYCYLCPTSMDAATQSMVHEDPEIGGQILDPDGVNLTPPSVGLETRYWPLTAIKEISDDVVLTRCDEASPSFTDSVRKMMEVMRLFSFVEPVLPEEPEPAAGTEGGVEGEGDPAEVTGEGGEEEKQDAGMAKGDEAIKPTTAAGGEDASTPTTAAPESEAPAS